MEKIKKLFSDFLIDSINDKDIIYCLTQSTVEPVIRFKFGSWISKHHSSTIKINILEINRVDLILGDDDNLFFIEFGHLVNLLKHTTFPPMWKSNNDCDKLEGKIISFKKKNEKLSEQKKIHKLTLSLYSDFKGEIKNNQFTPNYAGILDSGVFLKYGKSKKYHKWFDNYIENLRNGDKNGKYIEHTILENQLSLWWLIRECGNNNQLLYK